MTETPKGVQNPAYSSGFSFFYLYGMKKYKLLLKEKGWKAVVNEAGWKVAMGLFLFFLVKGLVWLAVIYGGLKWFTS
ncbi:hypothetical protein JCM30197_06780 [Schleiferia thermophila]|jgi:hypothetical protein|nr:hypothetical protein JCM30197_06780 [Schleiferia thermophila]